MTNPQYLLETRNLHKRFGGVDAIANVDFKLSPGELRCLIGPNGAGKSTFFKMLTAQIAPSSGAIYFNNQDITRATTHQVSRLGIGIKNQIPDVFDNLSVKENIWLAARFRHKEDKAEAMASEALDRLSLKHLARELVGELAHGQRQWVEFGMVMALEPQLVLLDEPTAGMTAEETNRTAQLICELNKTSAIIVVEHDMQFIRQIAKKVTVFHQGKILVEDTMQNVQANEMVRDVYLGKSGHA
jgi:branched-chain amino acid transport system ATP-binding protein